MFKKLTYILLASPLIIAVGCSGSDSPEGPIGGGNNGGGSGGYVDKKIYVSSAEQFNALSGLVAGDTVVLANGTYNNKALVASGAGTQEKPIVFMGAEEGKVILTGNSTLTIAGDYLTVANLWFKDVVSAANKHVIDFRRTSPSPTVRSTNCRLTNCAITGINTPQLKNVDYKWVSIHGSDNTVDNCSFIDKRNIGTTLVVWLAEGVIPRHTIKNNYFTRPVSLLDDDGNQINGQETIRIGDSSSSMQESRCVVEGNEFFMCDAEIEIISNKSCFNTYRNNLFRKSSATLTLRHGNSCTVENNFFIGDGVANSGGVRVIGEKHTVRGNYFENLTGTGYRTAISLIRGTENPQLHEYYQVRNALISGNTIVDCRYGINVNYGANAQTMPVISTVVTGNIISNAAASNVAINLVSPPTPEITWSGNTVWGGKYTGGVSTAEVPMTNTQPQIGSRVDAYQKISREAGASWTIN